MRRKRVLLTNKGFIPYNVLVDNEEEMNWILRWTFTKQLKADVQSVLGRWVCKKTQKTPKKEIDLAKKYRDDYLNRRVSSEE